MKNKKTFKHKIHPRNGHLIAVGNTVSASDFLTKSTANTTPASNSGKVAKMESNGFIDPNFVLNGFGGDGSDGALTVTSGTTTIDLAGASVVIKNYTSISITGTGKVAFINPHANGTIIIFRSRGNVTLTSSATPLIDISELGSSAGNNGNVINLPVPTNCGVNGGNNSGGTGGASIATALTLNFLRSLPIAVGTAGGNGYANDYNQRGGGGGGHLTNSGSNGTTGFGTPNGNGSAGSGGRGGGALLIECAGAYNFTGTIWAKGGNGTSTANTSGSGGGGGSGGWIGVLYNSLTANSGTYTLTGGTGGTGGSTGNGGNGATGYQFAMQNKYFV